MDLNNHRMGFADDAIDLERNLNETVAQRDSTQHSRVGSAQAILVAGMLLIGCFASWLVIVWNGGQSTQTTPSSTPTPAVQPVKPSDSSAYPVTIGKPNGPPQVDTGLTDANGEAVTVSCSTCHANRQPNFENRVVENLNEFHGSLEFSHGTVSCLSCHNSNDYDALKLADGSRVEFTDVMTLCAQCHGPQMTDYEHGAHGGMNGYWDLTRGPQTKNNCVDCHHPHSPQFPKMQPMFKPRDRFLEKEVH